ncbi:MAG: hypothetical protein P1U47_10355 [Zhongshania sp.]|uniref:hypothetical protein n=1 Tax=Zhongshania sp. TaxID=1971902 RepID=UPI0026240F71|nr:hypothetical protein [Zhongshania sp.]MDF1692766.1 hypothetical protein [Zhongshania sp.]
MKTIQHILLTFGLVIGALNSAHAGEATKDLVAACKNSTMEKFSENDDTTRTRFKGISGPSNSRKVQLLVLPKDQANYRAECFIDAKTQEVLSIEKLG